MCFETAFASLGALGHHFYFICLLFGTILAHFWYRLRLREAQMPHRPSRSGLRPVPWPRMLPFGVPWDANLSGFSAYLGHCFSGSVFWYVTQVLLGLALEPEIVDSVRDVSYNMCMHGGPHKM